MSGELVVAPLRAPEWRAAPEARGRTARLLGSATVDSALAGKLEGYRR